MSCQENVPETRFEVAEALIDAAAQMLKGASSHRAATLRLRVLVTVGKGGEAAVAGKDAANSSALR